MTTRTADDRRRELLELLAEERSSALRREASAFDGATAPFDRLVLHGAGNLGRRTLRGLREVGREPLVFTDNAPELQGQLVDGIPVLSPEEAARRFGQSAAFVLTVWRGESTERMDVPIRQLRELGCARVVPFAWLYWKYPEQFLPHYSVDLPHRVLDAAEELRKAYDLLADDFSRQEYVSQVRWRLRFDIENLTQSVAPDIYFPSDLVQLSPAGCFVDCGAYDGDSIRAMLAHRADFEGRIIAFEPDIGNYRKLEAFVASLPETLSRRINTHRLGVGARRQRVRFDSDHGPSSAVGRGSGEIEITSLDEMLEGVSPTFVKMDVEGHELDALAGARATIVCSRPALAICVYHAQDHVWQVPLMVARWNDGYRFHLRPHNVNGWDLVSYAIPRDA